MPPRIADRRTPSAEPDAPPIARETAAAGKLPRVRQVAYIVARAHKPASLERVLDIENPASALVFCRTRLEVDTLAEMLNARGHRAEALHGGLEQRQRDRVMSRFREGKADLLVATDVAARGLDIERLSHVINYDVPASAETYVHRIGRTGRAGRGGTAITLAEPREHRLLRAMEAATKQKIEVAPIPTVADLRARRLEITRASLRERLLAGNLDHTRVVVEALANEFDIVDIAAAAVQLAHTAAGGDGDDREIPAAAAPSRPSPGRQEPPAEAGTRPAAARCRHGRADQGIDPAVRRCRTPGGNPPGRSRRRYHRRSRHRVALHRRDRDQRWLLARRGAGDDGRRRHRRAAGDELRGLKVTVRRER